MKRVLINAALLLASAGAAFGGRIVVSNLDADFHASFDECAGCLNPGGAQSFIQTAVSWVRNGSVAPFLFVQSSIIPPYADYIPGTTEIDGWKAFHRDGEIGLEKSGFTVGVDFETHDASTLANALMNLSSYSAIVIASDWGGILTGAELAILNAYKSEIAEFIAGGGGIYAMAESNGGIGSYDPLTGHGLDENFTDATHTTIRCCMGLLGSEERFGFLPIPVFSNSSYGAYDEGISITAAGLAMGLTTNMLTGNYSEIYLDPSPGYEVLSTDKYGRAATIAADYSGFKSSLRIARADTPEPASTLLVALGGIGGLLARVCRRRKV